MADILSQEEINALIEAYKASGSQDLGTKVSERQVRLYDFGRPDKFSKEHLKALNMIYTKHGVSFAAALSSLLRVPTQIEVLALDQLTYREYCASVPDNTLFVEIGLEPLASTALFEFNPMLVSRCVDLLAGASPTTSVSSPEITEIDRAILKPIVELALKQYAEAWSTCIDLTPRDISLAPDPNNGQALLSAEAVLVCNYEVTIGQAVSMMSICIPATSVETVLPVLTLGRNRNSPSQRDEKMSNALQKSFEGVEIESRAFLGKTSLPLEDIVNLEVGDLIRLPGNTNGSVELWMENVAAFTGTLGVSGKNLAIKIAKPLRDLDIGR